jgi:drug/metabolite transporter (DMT)-like permease
MVCWFTGVSYLQLNQSTALSFTSPLFATIFAVLVLHEVVRARRWTATIVGFIGAMVVVRPGFAEFRWEYAIILVSALLTGLTMTLMKQLTRTESPNAIVLYLTLYILPVSFLLALPGWIWPPAETWPIVVALGAFGMLGHQAMTRAFAAIDASAVTALDFVRLPFVAALAWPIFAETPDVWTWAGAAIIVASTVYITHREAAAARERRMAKSPVSVATIGPADPTPLTPVPPRDRPAE